MKLSTLTLFVLVQLGIESHAWLEAAKVTSLDLAEFSPERRCILFPTCLLDPYAFINKATYRPAQTLFSVPEFWLNTSALPGFCQLELSITTNEDTGRTVGAELWLPDEWDWNGRILATGSYSALAFDGIQQGYASYISRGGIINGGHDFASTEDLERMAMNPENDEELLDYSWRALHSTTVHAKVLVETYYGRSWTKSYFSGCGGGGRQGIKAMATFPEDYDGLLLGSPEHPLSDLIPWKLQLERLVQELRWLPQVMGFFFPWQAQSFIKQRIMVHEEVLKQCDGLDGVIDGVISFPEDCHFRPEVLACRPEQKWPCLTLSALELLRRLYTPLLDAEQSHVFSPLMPGAEYWTDDYWVDHPPDDPSFNWRWPADYYRRFVSNSGYVEDSFVSPSGRVANIDRTFNPAEIDTYTPDLTAFFKRGGKVIQYTGWNDDRVSPGNSIKWYRDVFAYTLRVSDLNPDDYFRLFMVPGMKHCTGGDGAWLFGGHGQRSKAYYPDEEPWDGTCYLVSAKKQYRYLHLLQDYDKGQTGPVNVQAALVDWVEKGVPVDHLIATKYEPAPDQLSFKVNYTRKLCPWPQRATFLGGDKNSHTSFECR